MNFAEALRMICGRCKRDPGTCKTCPVFTVVEETESEAYIEHQLQLIRSINYTKKGNWYNGTIGDGFTFQVKLAEEDSLFGIDNGRIIKLFVTKPTKKNPRPNPVIAYERSWCIRPTDDPELCDILDTLFIYFQEHAEEV